MDLEVQLRARGIGSTLFCKDDLSLVDFETRYTEDLVVKEYFLENRGQKP